jgi:phage terminase small subunit
MTANNIPEPPTTLSKKSAAYFKTFVSDYEVDDSHVEVLIRVCESMDRADQAAAGLKEHGSLMTKDRFGCERAHPLIQVERQARAAIIDGIKALGVLKHEKTGDRYSDKVF